MLTRHTDRVRLAAHRYVTKRAVEEEYCMQYGALHLCAPARLRVCVFLPISTFGAIGTPGDFYFMWSNTGHRRRRQATADGMSQHIHTTSPESTCALFGARQVANWRCGDGGGGGGAE